MPQGICEGALCINKSEETAESIVHEALSKCNMFENTEIHKNVHRRCSESFLLTSSSKTGKAGVCDTSRPHPMISSHCINPCRQSKLKSNVSYQTDIKTSPESMDPTLAFHHTINAATTMRQSALHNSFENELEDLRIYLSRASCQVSNR
jgi:hypothetical protein